VGVLDPLECLSHVSFIINNIFCHLARLEHHLIPIAFSPCVCNHPRDSNGGHIHYSPFTLQQWECIVEGTHVEGFCPWV